MESATLEILRRRRLETQSDTAKAVGMSVAAYNKKERGLVEFKPSEIAKLKEHFGLTLEEAWGYFFAQDTNENVN